MGPFLLVWALPTVVLFALILAVFAAAASATGRNAAWMSLIFLGYLLTTTAVYVFLTSPAEAQSAVNVLMIRQRPFMQWPSMGALWREAWGTVRQFFIQALPVFLVICVAASLFARLGVLDACSQVLGPVMGLFDLPVRAALPVVLASIRKDGIFPDSRFPIT